jgi:hypothetical protein
MASVYQGEEVLQEQQLSPQELLRQQWQQQPGSLPFLLQKNVIDQNAELIPYAATAGIRGWFSPGLFALQGLVLVAIIFSALNWQFTRHAGKMEEEIAALQASTQNEVQRQDEIIAATEAEIRRISNSSKPTFKLHLSPEPLTREQALAELNSALAESHNSEDQYKQKMAAREQELRARQSALAIANSVTPLIFSLALLMAAGLFSQFAQKDFRKNRHARRLADFYLYFATAEGVWPNLVLLMFLHIALSRNAYGVSDALASVGPLFWVVFWLGFYFLLLRYFVTVARDLYKAMQVRIPTNEWGFDNKLLFRIHNSFFIVFAGLEVVFLALCYGFYKLS